MGGRDGDRPKAEHGSDVRGIRPGGSCRAWDVLGSAAPRACPDIQCRSSLTPPVTPAAFFINGDVQPASAVPARRRAEPACGCWPCIARDGRSARRHPARHGQLQGLGAGRRGWLPGRIVLDHHTASDPGALGGAQADGFAHLEGGSVGSAAGAGRLGRDRFARDRRELAQPPPLRNIAASAKHLLAAVHCRPAWPRPEWDLFSHVSHGLRPKACPQ